MKTITIRTTAWEITLTATGNQGTMTVSGTDADVRAFTEVYPAAMDEGPEVPTAMLADIMRHEVLLAAN